ncbi:unnamed protein product [Caenorhabditis angaria]|uniref:Uncharacterized protein n=1 Tax=Caenorhabditis angaria TaxID=860376 RepID=A0A9P1MYP5_9PELO|nr:unnamed protein product [Caenorhabditis angaria]
MLILSIIFLVFALKLDAGVIPTSTSTTPTFNVTFELEKIAESCLTVAEYNELGRRSYSMQIFAQLHTYKLITVAQFGTLNSVMRKMLGFSQYRGTYRMRPIQDINKTMSAVEEKP